MNLGENCGSLVEYLKAFDVTLRVLQTEDALYRVAYELAEDAARENVRYMEVRYSPMLHTRRGLKLTQRRRGGARRAPRRAGQATASSRTSSSAASATSRPRSSLEMAELAVAYKNRGVVGFDLAGAEYDHPAKHHKAAFQLVRDNNINVTIHAGEAYGPESIAPGASTSAARTASATAAACARTATCSTTSTITASRSSAARRPTCRPARCAISRSHPLKLYFNLGLRVTVNTDNRLITDTTVSKELWLCHTQMGFTLDDIKQIIMRRLQERVPAVPREAAVPAPRERGANAFVHEQAAESSRNLQGAAAATATSPAKSPSTPPTVQLRAPPTRRL